MNDRTIVALSKCHKTILAFRHSRISKLEVQPGKIGEIRETDGRTDDFQQLVPLESFKNYHWKMTEGTLTRKRGSPPSILKWRTRPLICHFHEAESLRRTPFQAAMAESRKRNQNIRRGSIRCTLGSRAAPVRKRVSGYFVMNSAS